MGHVFLIEIAGAVALLLWATRMVKTGILRAYEAKLRQWLSHSLDNRARAFGVGMGIAVSVQSSTATAMLMASFAERGLVGTAAGIAVLLGADLGSTLVVQLLSLDLGLVTPILLVAGYVCFSWFDRVRVKQMGRVLIGLALLLLSLKMIGAAGAGLASSTTLAVVLDSLASDSLLALVLGAGLAWAAHSSVATVLLIASLAASGLVPPLLALALVAGANVGGGLISVGLTWRSSAAARRAPLANLAARAAIAVVSLFLMPLALQQLSALDSGADRLVVNFHTAFNIVLALIFLPLAHPLGRLIERWVPDKLSASDAASHLDEAALERPQVALAAATREVLAMADRAERLLTRVVDAFQTHDADSITELSREDDELDRLHERIKLYIARVMRQSLTAEQGQRATDILLFSTNLEHVGDIIDRNLLELAQKKLKRRLTFSEQGWSELRGFHEYLVEQFKLAIAVFVTSDRSLARQMIEAKESFRERVHESAEQHLDRLHSGKIESIESSALHLDLLRDFKRINSHLVSVAYPILEAEGELRESRLKHPDEPRRANLGVAE
jgi:phosphate:Na+ symporter